MRKACFRAAAPVVAVLLSSCGGGGGGGIVSTPPPPVTPSAFPLGQSASFDTISASRSYHNNGSGQTAVDAFGVTGLGSNVAISYDALTNSYTVKNGLVSASFNPSNLTSNGFIDTYMTQPPGLFDELKLYNNVRAGSSQGGAPVQLTYLSYGAWRHNDYSGVDELSTTYFLFGYPTPNANVPKTGTATYQTAVTGNLVTLTYASEADVGGTATFVANFANASISTDLTLNVVSTGADLGTYHGAAAIAGNQFSGNFTASDPYLVNGGFAGGFFGPSANEVGYTFDIKRGVADPYAGASPAPYLSWITGVVVGRKN